MTLQIMARMLVGILACLCLTTAAAQDFRDEFTSVTRGNFDSGGKVSRQFHLNAESYFRMATVARRSDARLLNHVPSSLLASKLVRANSEAVGFADYVARDPLIDGVVVVHDGNIVFEAYPNMDPWQRHFAWSVTKVVTSAALAVLVERGLVDMDEPVDRYVSALSDTAWAGIAVQNIADMASGIDCLDSDGYQDSSTCVYTMEESLNITAPTGRELDFIEHLRGMQVRGVAGTSNEYVSANTNVLMLVIEAVTGQSFARVLQELVWNPIGAEADALLAISEAGYAYASGGLHARLRDVARFGHIFAQPELSGVLSSSIVQAMQKGGIALEPETLERLEESLGDDLPVRSSWQWDLVWSDGAMFKAGYSGQGLYVDPDRDLVITWFGTGLNYEETTNSMLPVSRQIARSGIFASSDASAETAGSADMILPTDPRFEVFELSNSAGGGTFASPQGKVLMSFISKDARYCRAARLSSDYSFVLACRDERGWKIEASSQLARGRSTVTRVFGGGDMRAVSDAIEALRAGPDFLDDREVIEAASKGWRNPVAIDSETLDARQILKRVAQVYRTSRSYVDTGTVHTVYKNQRREFTGKTRFSTAYVAPADFRFESSMNDFGTVDVGFIAWLDQDGARAWSSLDSELFEDVGTIQSALDGAAGISRDSSGMIPGLIFPGTKLGGDIVRLTSAERLDDQQVDGYDCFQVQGFRWPNAGDPTTVWIDKDSFLIRKVYEEGRIKDGTTRTTWSYQPAINVPVAAEVLADAEPTLD